jgi:selT/selW/selH-like putative selenoprotein
VKDRFDSVAGAQVTLIRGGGGAFEITIDDTLVFSKKALGRFPNDAEVDSMLAG